MPSLEWPFHPAGLCTPCEMRFPLGAQGGALSNNVQLISQWTPCPTILLMASVGISACPFALLESEQFCPDGAVGALSRKDPCKKGLDIEACFLPKELLRALCRSAGTREHLGPHRHHTAHRSSPMGQRHEKSTGGPQALP